MFRYVKTVLKLELKIVKAELKDLDIYYNEARTEKRYKQLKSLYKSRIKDIEDALFVFDTKTEIIRQPKPKKCKS